MDTPECLQPFCSTDPTREPLQKPFSVGDYTYATEGHAAVRVKRIDLDLGDEHPMHAGYAEELDKLLGAECGPAAPLPETPAKAIDCSHCDGTGKSKTAKCPECDGDGVVEAHTDFNSYDVECDTCGGTGRVDIEKGEPVTEDCEYCSGEGSVAKYDPPVFRIGGVMVNAAFLSFFQAFSNVRVAAAKAERRGLKNVHLTFDGGSGVIAGLFSNELGEVRDVPGTGIEGEVAA